MKKIFKWLKKDDHFWWIVLIVGFVLILAFKTFGFKYILVPYLIFSFLGAAANYDIFWWNR